MRTVILAEGIPMFRQGARALLSRTGKWNVLDSTNQVEIMELAQLHQPDCAIVDSGLASVDSLETCWMLRQTVPTIGILILTSALNEEQLFQFFIHGANAYEPRSIEAEVFLDRVERVSRGEYVIGSELLMPRPVARIAPGLETRPRGKAAPAGVEKDPTPSPLSGREIQILQQIAYGNSNKQIGAALKISDQTVKNHITSTLRKLSVNDRTAAVMYGISRRWISMDGPGAVQRAAAAPR